MPRPKRPGGVLSREEVIAMREDDPSYANLFYCVGCLEWIAEEKVAFHYSDAIGWNGQDHTGSVMCKDCVL